MLHFRNAGSSKLTKTFSKRIFTIKLLYFSRIVRTLCPCLLSANRVLASFSSRSSRVTPLQSCIHTLLLHYCYTLLPTRQRHRHWLTARSCPNYSACLHCTRHGLQSTQHTQHYLPTSTTIALSTYFTRTRTYTHTTRQHYLPAVQSLFPCIYFPPCHEKQHLFRGTIRGHLRTLARIYFFFADYSSTQLSTCHAKD